MLLSMNNCPLLEPYLFLPLEMKLRKRVSDINIWKIVRPFTMPSLIPLALLATTGSTGSAFGLGTVCNITNQSEHEVKFLANDNILRQWSTIAYFGILCSFDVSAQFLNGNRNKLTIWFMHCYTYLSPQNLLKLCQIGCITLVPPAMSPKSCQIGNNLMVLYWWNGEASPQLRELLEWSSLHLA